MASLIQDKIVEVFEKIHVMGDVNVKHFKAVGTPGQGVNTDYRIVTEIKAFQFEERTEGVKTRDCKINPMMPTPSFDENRDDMNVKYWAKVKISAKIIYERKGRVIASNTYCAETTVGSKRVYKVVDGLNIALGEVLKSIAQDTVDKINDHSDELKDEAEKLAESMANCSCEKDSYRW